jgi:hypothetical protein
MAKRSKRGGGSEQNEGGGKRGGGGLSGISVHDLRRELASRQRRAGSLSRKRAVLVEKLRRLDQEIGGLGELGGGGNGVRRRPRNEMNLVGSLAALLDGKTMSVTEIAEEVQKAGYMTTSPSFRTIVNQTLINSGKFKRVSRGMYTAK